MGKFDGILICSDWDGTLFTGECVPEDSVRAIKYFQDNGRFDYKAAEKDGVMKILDVDYSRPLLHSAPMEDMIEYVKEHNFVPVVDDRGCFIGIILRRDVLAFLFNHYQKTSNE